MKRSASLTKRNSKPHCALQKFIGERPEFAYAHFQLAYVYTALMKTDEARAEYERTMPSTQNGRAYLILGFFHEWNPPAEDRAIAPLRKAVELMPGQKQPLRDLLSHRVDRGMRLGRQNHSKRSCASTPTMRSEHLRRQRVHEKK